MKKQIDSLYLETAVEIVVGVLSNNPTYHTVSTSSGDLMLDNDEVVQIQVQVVRRKKDFIDDFTNVCLASPQKLKG